MIRRTAAITAASIAGVILAGGAAVGANIGILNAADDNTLGTLSAEAPITTPATASAQPLVDVTNATGTSQRFTVDNAGTVEVEFDDNGLRLKDVRTSQGWAWEETSTDSTSVTVRFTSGADALEFSAIPNDDGTISAGVERPVITSTPTTISDPNSYDDDYDDEHDDYDDEHDEHEGRDYDD
jgi:hypothetical protein